MNYLTLITNKNVYTELIYWIQIKMFDWARLLQIAALEGKKEVRVVHTL